LQFPTWHANKLGEIFTNHATEINIYNKQSVIADATAVG
jgi:hypothetical protein